MEIDVKAAMERWARWRARGVRFRWDVPCMTGRIMAGMRSTACPICRGRGKVEGWKVGSTLEWVHPCPTCNGQGKVKGDLGATKASRTLDCYLCDRDESGKPTGQIRGHTCFKCGGRGRRQIVSKQVNPAGIHATVFAGANEDDDPISELIDRTVAGWETSDDTFWMHVIVFLEYGMAGTQRHKARRIDRFVERRKGISQGYYSKILNRAHSEMGMVLQRAVDTGIIRGVKWPD